MNKKYQFLYPFLFAAIMAVGMLFGYKLSDSMQGRSSLFSKQENNKVTELLGLLKVQYVDTIDQNLLLDELTKEIVDKLDPHSFYIAKKEVKSISEDMAGAFEGIGIEFFIVKDTVMVVSAIAGGPSETLGIQAGDKIIKIEDTLIAGIGFRDLDVVSKLRGPKETDVNISILRPGVKELLDFTITRDKIPLYSVDVAYMIDSLTGYIKVNRFSETTYTEFLRAIRKMDEQGIRKLIVDLRDNPGGLLNQATELIDELLPANELIVYTKGRNYSQNDYKTKSLPGLFEGGQLAILIDEGSASASEIVAGAIQDKDRGLIVGRRSFGKGLVQEQYKLQDGSEVRLTVARYYTPSGRSIQKPYENGEGTSYNEEVYDRYMSGELLSADSISLPDSLLFYTANGRPVYGGGGIMPDVFIPIDTANVDLWSRVRSQLQQYIYDYYAQNLEAFKDYKDINDYKANYQLPDSVYQGYIAHMNALSPKITVEYMAPVEAKTRTYLSAYIARQIWRNNGFYPLLNEIDPVVIESVRLLHNRAEYKEKLSGKSDLAQ